MKKERNIDINYIYSETIDGMIPRGFTRKGFHYTWNEADALYYRDDVDDRMMDFEDVDWTKVERIG